MTIDRDDLKDTSEPEERDPEMLIECPYCDGDGYHRFSGSPCAFCEGTGFC